MKPYLWMLWGAVSFAFMGAFAHGAGKYCDWQMIALSRSTLALLIAGLLAFREQTPLVFLRPWTLWMRSIAGSMSVMCNFYALSRLPVADSLTLSNMFPVWIAVLSWPMLGKAPDREVWIGVLCGVSGVAIMQQPYLADGNLGTLAAVTGSFTSAVALIGLHRLGGVSPKAIVVHFSFVSILFVVAAFFVFPLEHSLSSQLVVGWPALALLLGVGVSATIGQLLLTRAFGAGSPAKVSVIGLSQVGFAMIFDVLLWDRAFEWHTLVGMALVIGPSAWLILRRPPVDDHNTDKGT